MTPTIIVVRREAELRQAQRRTEVEIAAGRPVNVFAEHRLGRSLVVRVVPLDRGVLVLSPNGTLTGQHELTDVRLDRQFADGRKHFAPDFDRW